ncbi:DMT family transporter [Rubneribacter sp.]
MGGIGAFTRFINAPGDFVSFGRQLCGFIALSIAFCFQKGKWEVVKNLRISPAIIGGGITLGLLSGLYVISTQYTTLANASLLIYIAPVISTILAAIFLKEKINIQRAICLCAVVIGMLFTVGIITPEGFTLDLAPEYMFGNGIALLSGLAYGLYLFFGRYRQDADSSARSWYQFGIAAITLIGLMIVDSVLSGGLKYTVKVGGITQIDPATGQIMTANWDIFTMDATSWIVWVAAAFISGFIAFHLLTYACKMLTAAELASISYQEVVMASLLGFFLFQETMTPFQMIGFVLIVGGGFIQIFFTTKEGVVVDDALAAQIEAGKVTETVDAIAEEVHDHEEKEAEVKKNLSARLDEAEEKEGLK